MDGNSVRLQLTDGPSKHTSGLPQRLESRDLRADVNVNRTEIQLRKLLASPIKIHRRLRIQPELCGLDARRDVTMGFGIDTRIDSHAHPRAPIVPGRDPVEKSRLTLGLQMKEEDVRLDSGLELPLRLPHAGEDDPVRGHAHA
jgi:hypothetical protein